MKLLEVMQPLRRRLPLLITSLLFVVVAAASWSAYHYLEGALIIATGDRITAATQRLSLLLDESANRVRRDAQRIAALPAVVAAARSGGTSQADEARLALDKERLIGTEPALTIAVLDPGQHTLIVVGRANPAAVLPPRHVLASAADTLHRGWIGPFATFGDSLYFSSAAPIIGTKNDTLGYVVINRALVDGQSQSVSALIGAGATLAIANADGTMWNDLFRPVAGPPKSLAPGAAQRYDAPNGDRLVGAVLPLRAAPWQVAVAVPVATALLPARPFVDRLIVIGLVVLAAGALGAWLLSQRVTAPLLDVTRAAADFAGGDYSRRAPVTGNDEIASMAIAFNRMAEQVESASSVLEDQAAELEAANEELRQSEESFRILADSAPVLAWTADPQGRLDFFNARWLEFTGRAHGVELGDGWRESVHPDDLDAVLATARAAYAALEPFSLEARLRRHDGEHRWMLVSGVPRTSGSGQFEGYVGACVDITQRHDADERVRQSERQLAEAQRIANVGSWQVDTETRTITWSDEMFRIFGEDPRTFVPSIDTVLKRIHPEDRARTAKTFMEKDAGTAYTREIRITRRDGSERTLRSGAELQQDAAGRMVLVGSVQDITAQRAAEAALRESELRYRGLVEHSPDAIIVHRGMKLLFANDAAAKLVGATSAIEKNDRSVLDFVHPADRAVAAARIHRNGELRQPTPLLEQRMVTLDGAVINVETIGMPFTLDGQPAVLTIIRDVSERKRLETHVRQAQRMEAVGQLAGGIAHDFNNLLTVITSYSAMLLAEDGTDPSVRADLEEIKNAADRAAGLTRQLLAFSRRQLLQPRVIDINELTQNLEKMLRRLLREDIELVTNLDPDLGLIHADPGQLEQVIVNLVVNARDAMPNGGHLSITTTNVTLDDTFAPLPSLGAGNYVMLAVSDTGHGMSDAVKSKIFEPFFTTKDTGKGTGLGLSTVYGIVQQTGGSIWVYSEVDHGTTFRIYLPLADTARASRDVQLPRIALSARSETILLVEDEELVRRAARRILERSGYVVLEAATGAEAVRICENHPSPIGLVVTDMVMPEMGGRELSGYVGRLRPDAKILFMSGYTEDVALHQNILAPGALFLDKPFTPVTLTEKVREALNAA